MGAGASSSLISLNNKHYEKIEKIRLPTGFELINLIIEYKVYVGYAQWVKQKNGNYQHYIDGLDIFGDLVKQPDDEIENSNYNDKDKFHKVIDNHKTEFPKYIKNFKNISNLTDVKIISDISLQYVYIASLLVGKYYPLSIDYFVHNLEFFVSSDLEELNNMNIEINKLKIYLKAVVCEIIYNRQESTVKTLDGFHEQDNYIKSTIWSMSLEANEISGKTGNNINVQNYIQDNLSIITFNYDTTVEYLLKKNNIKIWDDKSNIGVKIKHVYGKIGNLHNENNLIKIILNLKKGTTEQLEEYLNSCDKNIDWIRHKNFQNTETKNLIDETDNIYFLGFGFDANNLNEVGFNLDIKDLHCKKIFVSKSNGIINDILVGILKKYRSKHLSLRFQEDEFNLIARYGDNTCFVSNISPNNLILSFKDIKTAFKKDFK